MIRKLVLLLTALAVAALPAPALAAHKQKAAEAEAPARAKPGKKKTAAKATDSETRNRKGGHKGHEKAAPTGRAGADTSSKSKAKRKSASDGSDTDDAGQAGSARAHARKTAAGCAPAPAHARGKHAKARARSAAACKAGLRGAGSDTGGDESDGGSDARARVEDCASGGGAKRGAHKGRAAKALHSKRGKPAHEASACKGAAADRGSAADNGSGESADQDCAPAPQPRRARGRHSGSARRGKVKGACRRASGRAEHAERGGDCSPAARESTRGGGGGRHGKGAAHGKAHKGSKSGRGRHGRPVCVKKQEPVWPKDMKPAFLPPPARYEPPPEAAAAPAKPAPGDSAPATSAASAGQKPEAAYVRPKNPPPGATVVYRPDLADIWARRRAVERKPRPAAASLSLAAILGRSEGDLKSQLGDPDLKRSEGDGALWTYRLPNCSLLVFLHRGAGQSTWKISGAQAGPLARGDPAPDVDSCLRQAGGRQ